MHINTRFGFSGLAGAAVLIVALSACGTSQSKSTTVGGAQAVTAQLPATATQQVTIDAREFSFTPNTVRLTVGQPEQLTMINVGQVDHDIKSAMPIKDLSYQKADNDADEQVTNAAQGVFDLDFNQGHSAQITFTPTQAGTFQFYCDEPGHKEGGMIGTFIVQ